MKSLIVIYEVFNDNIHEYDKFMVNLVATEHSKLIWLRRENLDSLKWAPAAVDSLIKEVI